MTRFRAVVSGCVLVLTLSACGGKEAGPAPARQVQDPGVDALPLKLDALSTDPCFLTPEQQVAKGCEKYVTELGNTAASVRKRVSGTDRRLTTLADQLDKTVNAYRGNGCAAATTRGVEPCTQVLSDLATTLDAVRTAVKTQITTG